MKPILFTMVFALIASFQPIKAQSQPCLNQDTLVVLWTSAEKAQALDMILWYTSYAKSQDWWKEIVIISWGPSNNLIAEDEEVQKKIKEMLGNGVKFLACKGCADKNNIAQPLIDLGVEVIYVGGELTAYLKGGYPMMTF
jgi:hypothetical protein